MKWSRRSFLKGAGVVAAASALQPVAQVFGAPALIQAAKPLTIGINAEVSALDPHHVPGSIIGNRIFNFIFDQLTQIDLEGQVQPMLATEWQNDGVTWMFTLRPDVQFHDGTVMTAADAAYSLNRLLFSEQPSQIRAAFTPFIESVEASDDLMLTIITKFVDPLLPLRLATPNAAIMPQAYAEATGFDALQTAPMGAGPYRVAEFIPGDRLVMERHSGYWGGEPVATDVTVRLIPEDATRIAALQAGEVDLITTVPPDLIELINADPTRIDRVSLYNWMLIYFNSLKAPTSSVNLRKALSLSIDRELIASELWGGNVRVMNDYFLPGEFGHDAERPAFAFDLEAAARELEAAGYAGETIEFTPPGTYYTNGRLVTDVINEMWAAAGITVQYEPLDTAQWADRSLAGNNIATLQSFGTSGDAGTSSVAQSWGEGSWVRQYYVPSDEYAQLIQDAASSLDPAVRYENYRAVTAILDQDTPIAPLYQSVEFYGVNSGITWQPHQQFYIDLRPGRFSF